MTMRYTADKTDKHKVAEGSIQPGRITAPHSGAVTRRRAPAPSTRTIHIRLSPDDPKPRCAECGNSSLYYCNMNDQYFCQEHVVGHDKNEY